MSKDEAKVEQPKILDKAALLADTEFEQHDYEIPGWGTVVYRGMSRAEILAIRKRFSKDDALDLARIEQTMLARALINPTFTEEEIAKWQRTPHGKHLEALVDTINEESGLNEEAGKEATLQFPE